MSNRVKWHPLQISFGASLLIHAAGFGVIAWRGTLFHPPELLRENLIVTLTLDAAPPDEAASSEKPGVVVPVAPSGVEEIKKSETVIPIERVQPVQAVETPAPASPSKPATAVHGDGSSSEPGLDPATQTASSGAKAEPNYLVNPEPRYPLAARRRHQEGLVLLTVRVTAQGRAAEVTIKQSSGFPALNDAALQAVREWEFSPARIGALAVKSEIEVPVRFKLTD